MVPEHVIIKDQLASYTLHQEVEFYYLSEQFVPLDLKRLQEQGHSPCSLSRNFLKYSLCAILDVSRIGFYQSHQSKDFFFVNDRTHLHKAKFYFRFIATLNTIYFVMNYTNQKISR